jgi:hypothetical protein
MEEKNNSIELSPEQRKAQFKRLLRPYLFRFGIVLGISILLTIAFNELAFSFQREAFDRPPETIVLEIPEGTMKDVALGEAPPGIPSDLTFVVGDTLEVVNKDSESHRLGPLFIPADSVARMTFEEPTEVSYSCSFRPNNYLGIEVRQTTNMNTRILGLFLAAPTTATLFFLYSLIIFPVKPQSKMAVV